jgi:hypothetical protein
MYDVFTFGNNMMNLSSDVCMKSYFHSYIMMEIELIRKNIHIHANISFVNVFIKDYI